MMHYYCQLYEYVLRYFKYLIGTAFHLFLIYTNIAYISVQHGQAPNVRVVASLFREICYNNKDALQAGIIVAGWDKHHGGEVYSVPLGGSLHKQPFAIGGMLVLFISNLRICRFCYIEDYLYYRVLKHCIQY